MWINTLLFVAAAALIAALFIASAARRTPLAPPEQRTGQRRQSADRRRDGLAPSSNWRRTRRRFLPGRRFWDQRTETTGEDLNRRPGSH